MNTSLALYRFSLILTVILTTWGALAILSWLAGLINHVPLTLGTAVPWLGLFLLVFTALNCILRTRILSWSVRREYPSEA